MRRIMQWMTLATLAALFVPLPARTQEVMLTDQQRAILSDSKRLASMQAHLIRLQEFNQHGQAEIERVLKRLDTSLQKRKANARPFAARLLGIEGKLDEAGALAQKADRALSRMLGMDVAPSDPPGAIDSQQLKLALCLSQQVLKADDTEREIMRALHAYRGWLREQEAALLVEAGADVPEAELEWDQDLIPERLKCVNQHIGPLGRAAGDLLTMSRNDFAAMVGREILSLKSGDALAGSFTQKNDSAPRKLAINIAAGLIADAAIDRAAGLSGYDPERAATARIERALDEARIGMLEGDADAVRAYQLFRLCSFAYPDLVVRFDCSQAQEAMLANDHCRLGLRSELEDLLMWRFTTCMLALHRQVFGPQTPVVTGPVLDLETLPSRQKLLDLAQEWIALNGEEEQP